MNTLKSTQDPLAEIGNLLILIQIERMKRAAVALLDAGDAEFNAPFGQLCDLDAELLDLPSATPGAEEARCNEPV